MHKPKKSSKKMSTIINKTKLIMRLFPQGEKQTLRDFYVEKLEKLFDGAPSNLGYKADIESLLNDLGMSKEHLLEMTINSLSKSVRNKNEVKIIASYLFFMQDFLKLIRAKGISEKETILLKDLLTLSEAMVYEKQQKNTVLMRYGEKGNTAFIILSGQVDVLIETSSYKNLGEKSYLYYLANLIRYHEFGLVNLTVNDNFKKFPMEIIDDITLKTINNIINKQDSNSINNASLFTKKDSNQINFYSNKDINNIANPFSRKEKLNKTIRKQKGEGEDNEIPSSSRKNDTKREKEPKGFFRLSFMNEEIKDIKKVKQYRARELLDMFGLKLLDKKFNKRLNRCTADEYIERLDIFDYLDKKQKELDEKKEKLEKLKQQYGNNKIKLLNINLKNINSILNKANKINKEKKENNIKKNENKKENNKNNENIEKNENENNETMNKENDKSNSKNITMTENNDNNQNEDTKNDNDSEDNIINKSSSSSSSSSFMFEMNHNMIFGLKIFTYKKIVKLGTGCLFGEMALNDSNSLRKATIITSSNCHFSVLNKKTFNNCIKIGAQKHLRELLQFFIELPIFSGIPEGVFYHKYYTNLSKFAIAKGKNIIKQGEKPEHITLLQTGLYGVTTRMSLYELTRLIFHFAKFFNANQETSNDKKNKNNLKENNININNDFKSKYRQLFQNVMNLMNEENSLLNDNMFFKKFYFSQQFMRITEISCPDVVINEEYLDDNGLYAFSIEAKAPENIIYTLNNQFYVDLKNKNKSVKKNQDKLLFKKINLMIQRLLIIRNSMINSFFDYKSRNDVGISVIRELEDMIFKQLKKKRSVAKKDEKIILTNENENKENKDKEILMHLNTNSNGSNSYLFKNKKIEINSYKETGSSLGVNNSFSNIINNKKNGIKSMKLYKEMEKRNKSNKVIYNNKKQDYFQNSKDKNINFSNNYLNMYKKVLSTSPKKQYSITNKELNAANQLPYKDNEEEILFSLYGDNNDVETKYSITNYSNKIYNSNSNLSRNQKNQFTQIKDKKHIVFNSYGNKYDEQKNNIIFPSTRKVLMNSLIWENIKSVMKFPIPKNYNYIKTSNNFYKNKNINNNKLHNYLEKHLKSITNRNQYKIKKSIKTEENKFTKTYKNNSLSKELKEFSLYNFKLENINNNNDNNIHVLSSRSKNSYLSSIKNSIHKSQNMENRLKGKENPPLLNLKKNKNINEIPNIKIKLKKFYSPQEINFMRMSKKMRYVMDGNKYNKIKGEKFKINRNDYYEKNIKNRINFFYGFSPD